MPSNTKKYSLPINIRAQLYKGRITLSNGEIAIQPISDGKTYSVIYRIESYPVNRVIWPSNNLGLRYRSWWKAAAIFHKINGCFWSIAILQLWLSRSQVAQDPAVGWSSCELRVMAKLKEFVWEYLRPLLGIKKYNQILNKNTSPYFHSASLVIWPLTVLKRTHFSELSISRFTTQIRVVVGELCLGNCGSNLKAI